MGCGQPRSVGLGSGGQKLGAVMARNEHVGNRTSSRGDGGEGIRALRDTC